MVRWKLKQVLIEKKMNMMQVAQLSGISYSQIRRLCHYPYQDSTIRTLSRLADALEVPYSQLIESEHLTMHRQEDQQEPVVKA